MMVVRVAIKIGACLGLLLLAISGPAYAQSNAPPALSLPPARGPCDPGWGLIFMYDATMQDDGIPGPARVSWEQLDGPALARFNDRNVVQATMCVPQLESTASGCWPTTGSSWFPATFW